MHYYKRNIGDYAKKAARLSMLQHGAYTLLIDSCYDREEFPTFDMAIDWCWASNQDEIDAVSFVLNKFFVEENGVFVQKRIKEELEAYKDQSLKNKRIAIEREAKRKQKQTNQSQSATKREQSVDDSTPNQEPLNTNQEPLNTNQEPVNQNKDIGQSEIDRLFERFWLAGMRKDNKKKAKQVFTKILKTKVQKVEFTDYLIKDVKTRINNQQFGFSAMHPTTYLNGERWADDKTTPEKDKDEIAHREPQKSVLEGYKPPNKPQISEEQRLAGLEEIKKLKQDHGL